MRFTAVRFPLPEPIRVTGIFRLAQRAPNSRIRAFSPPAFVRSYLPSERSRMRTASPSIRSRREAAIPSAGTRGVEPPPGITRIFDAASSADEVKGHTSRAPPPPKAMTAARVLFTKASSRRETTQPIT